jgi:hypothetical protein
VKTGQRPLRSSQLQTLDLCQVVPVVLLLAMLQILDLCQVVPVVLLLAMRRASLKAKLLLRCIVISVAGTAATEQASSQSSAVAPVGRCR